MSDSQKTNKQMPWLGRDNLRALAALGALIILAVLLRAYKLGSQSAWWDDYNGLLNLEGKSLWTSLAMARRYNPHGAPLYHVVQYFSTFIIGHSPIAQRWLSILFGIATIPLIYLLGRDTFGKKAGLIAVLCFALSPIHIYHDQSIRLYPLMAFLAAVSVYALLRAVRGGGFRWWILNLLTNALIPWSHLLGTVLLVAEGCFLLARLPFGMKSLRVWKQAIGWGIAQSILLVPLAIWLMTMPWVPQNVFGHFKAPGWWDIFLDLFADDAIGTGFQIVPHGGTWSFISQGMSDTLMSYRPWADKGMEIVCCLGIAAAAVIALVACFRHKHQPKDSPEGVRTDAVLLMLVLWAIPVLTLAVMSHLWRPCTYPRYTIYSSIGLYVLIGGAIQAIPFVVLRSGAVAVVAALFAYQLSFTLPTAVRTDWMGTARQIRENASAQDIILVGGPGPANPHINIFAFNMGKTDLPILPVHTLQAAIDKARCYFLAHKTDPATAESPPSVWLVQQRYYEYGPLTDFEQGLAVSGMTFEHTISYADEKISLYRIRAGDNFDYSGNSPMVILPSGRDYEAALRFLGVSYTEQDPLTGLVRRDEGREGCALEYLRRVHDDFGPDFEHEDMGMMSTFLLEEGSIPLAAAAARKSIQINPQSPNGYVILLYVLLAEGKMDGAVSMGTMALEREPGNPSANLAMAFALFEKGDIEKAWDRYRQACALDKNGLGIELLETLIRAVYEQKDFLAARHEAVRLMAIHQKVSRFLMTKLGLDNYLTTCDACDT